MTEGVVLRTNISRISDELAAASHTESICASAPPALCLNCSSSSVVLPSSLPARKKPHSRLLNLFMSNKKPVGELCEDDANCARMSMAGVLSTVLNLSSSKIPVRLEIACVLLAIPLRNPLPASPRVLVRLATILSDLPCISIQSLLYSAAASRKAWE